MEHNFDQVFNRRGTDSEKWNRFPSDVLPLWVADMDFPTPDPIVQALKDRIEHRIFGYSNQIQGLREAILAWLEDRHQWKVQAEDIVFLPGVITGFNLAAQTFCIPSSSSSGSGGVLIQPPVYPPFLSVGKNARTPLAENPLLPPSLQAPHYTIDFEHFQFCLSERPSLFLLCSPHNPVGRVFQRSELEQLAEACLRNGTLICSDEIHSDLVYSESRHIPIASIDPEIGQKTITLMAPSKTFNIPSLEFAFAVIPNPELRKRFIETRRGLVGEANLLGMVAARAAYQHGGAWLREVLHYLQSNRDYLVSFLHTQLPGLKVQRPEGTYLAWIDCRDLLGRGPSAEEPAKIILQQARVGLNEGKTFGAGGQGFVRLNFACPRPILSEALNRILKGLI